MRAIGEHHHVQLVHCWQIHQQSSGLLAAVAAGTQLVLHVPCTRPNNQTVFAMKLFAAASANARSERSPSLDKQTLKKFKYWLLSELDSDRQETGRNEQTSLNTDYMIHKQWRDPHNLIIKQFFNKQLQPACARNRQSHRTGRCSVLWACNWQDSATEDKSDGKQDQIQAETA